MPEPGVTFYYPGMHRMESDGTIVMRATGWEGDWRWSGKRTFSPGQADYDFWRWVVAQGDRWPGATFFSTAELPRIQQEFENRRS